MNYTVENPAPNQPGVTDGHAGRPIPELLATARSIQELLERTLEEAGLSYAKYAALEALVRTGEPLTLSELAGRLCCVRSNITQLVDRLEGDGLVQRVSDPADRRAVRAVVTDRGAERQATGAAAIARIESELSARIAPADRTVFLRVLAALRT